MAFTIYNYSFQWWKQDSRLSSGLKSAFEETFTFETPIVALTMTNLYLADNTIASQ